MLHRKNWKRRFFALYSVPQGSVFVYYDKQSVSGDDILGFIDLRKATEVRNTTKTINKAESKVMEIITPSRTYSLAPLTVHKVRTGCVVAHHVLCVMGVDGVDGVDVSVCLVCGGRERTRLTRLVCSLVCCLFGWC
mgnify:CR=1 FL=1